MSVTKPKHLLPHPHRAFERIDSCYSKYLSFVRMDNMKHRDAQLLKMRDLSNPPLDNVKTILKMLRQEDIKLKSYNI